MVLIAFVPAAGLESIFAYCIGCRLFNLLMRLRILPQRMCPECSDISGRLGASA